MVLKYYCRVSFIYPSLIMLLTRGRVRSAYSQLKRMEHQASEDVPQGYHRKLGGRKYIRETPKNSHTYPGEDKR